jgi:hypothetical protein
VALAIRVWALIMENCFDIFHIKKAIVKEELGWICRCVMRQIQIDNHSKVLKWM